MKKNKFIYILIIIGLIFAGCNIDSGEDSNISAVSQEPVPTEIIPGSQPMAAPTSDSLVISVHFIDVGQADCIFIDAGDIDILIDGGNNSDGNLVVAYLDELGTDDIELMVATHPHEDHIGGLDNVIYNFDVEHLIRPAFASNTQTNRDFEEAIYTSGINESWPEQGVQFIFGELIFTVLSDNTKNYDETNDYSIVLKMNYGNHSFIFTGDAEVDVEHDILESGIDIKANVLKIGHHGSASSSTVSFINRINPDYTVISVGEGNKYGHPDPIILRRLELMDIAVLRTDTFGTIVFTTDGKNLSFEYSVGMPGVFPIRTEEPGCENIKIIDLNKRAEYIVIKNEGDSSVDMSGWYIVSIRGTQRFDFPDGYILNPDQECRITGYGAAGTGDFDWEIGSGIWNNTSDDDGALYNRTDELIDYWDD